MTSTDTRSLMNSASAYPIEETICDQFNGGPNHQRMGDRARHPVGVGLVEGSDDMHGDQARYTLLVRRYATREAAAHLFQGLGELAKRLGALANGLSRLRAIAAS